MSSAAERVDGAAMNQKTFLGLSHNPFTPPREGFFIGADRKTHLDHLRHLSQWSRRILVVSGPFGIGKSSLFRELSSSLEPNTKAARLSGTVVTTQREVLVGMLQGFGVAAQANAHTADLSRLIATHVNEQDAMGRICMVMVDDAHLLDAQALEQLMSLVGASALRLLLFTEASKISMLGEIAQDQELEWFEIRITGFPKAEIRNYLEWRFRQAQYRGRLPFTDEQLDKIVQRSGGNPSVVDSIANRLLTDMESGETRKQGSGFPMTHAALAIMLVVLMGLVYLFVQRPQDSPVELVERETVPLMPDEPAVSTEEVTDLTSPFADQAVDTPLVVEADVEVDVPTELEPQRAGEQPQPADQQPLVEPLDEPVLASETETVTAIPVERDTETEVQVSVQLEPEPEPEPAPVSAIPVVESSALPDGAFKSASWILQQDPNRFTLQLLSLSTAARAEAFMNRQTDTSDFAWYQMQRDNRTLYVIIYGVFSSREAAQSAVAGFSGEMASIKPWVRPLSLVQDTVRSNRQG
ncbi:MAG: AAA family ATPase [Pseudomonadales bacterium]|nr:AAA family ATPase [Pseudomonadales bacterium]